MLVPRRGFKGLEDTKREEVLVKTFRNYGGVVIQQALMIQAQLLRVNEKNKEEIELLEQLLIRAIRGEDVLREYPKYRIPLRNNTLLIPSRRLFSLDSKRY